MRTTRWSIAGLLVLCGVAVADGDPPQAAPPVVERVDLSVWNAGPIVHGPVLAAPTDLWNSASGTWTTSWSILAYVDRATPRPALVEFDAPALEVRSFSPDARLEDLQGRPGYDDALSTSVDDARLCCAVPP